MDSSTCLNGPSDGFLGLKHLQPIRTDFRQYAHDLAREYGDVVTFRIFGQPVFLFASPEHARQILVSRGKSFRKPDNQKRVFGRVLGNVSFIMDGDAWTKRRRMLSPVFSPQVIERYQSIVRQTAATVFDRCRPGHCHLSAAMNEISLTSVAEALFGEQFHEVAAEFHEQVMRQQEIVARQTSSPFLLPLWIPTRDNKVLRQSMRFFNELVERMIRERRASDATEKDLLSLLLEATDSEDSSRLSDTEARAEALTMLLAGNDTTAAALSWTAYLLSKHPKAQETLRNETQHAADVPPPARSDVHDYATCVFLEAMRLYPPAIAIVRQADERVEIGPATIPRGALVFVLVYTIHRDARWYSQPQEFDPERFRHGREQEIPEGAYLPFGLGPRACIGRRFAMMEGPIVVNELVRRFQLAYPDGMDDPEMETQLSLHPNGGLTIHLEPVTVEPIGTRNDCETVN